MLIPIEEKPQRPGWTTVVAVVALIVLAFALIVAGWLAFQEGGIFGPARQPGVLRLGVSAPVQTLEPILATTSSDYTLQAMLYEGLMAYGATLTPEPRLAASPPQPSADGLLWTIRCRPDVRFHDGTQFTCADAQARLDVLKTQRSTLVASDSPVDTVTLVALLDRIERTELADDFTLNVYLTAPFAFFNEALAHPAAAITRDELGTGPFQLVDWNANSATLTGFDAYWNGSPELDEINLLVTPQDTTRLNSLGSAFDAVDAVPPAATLSDDHTLVSGPGARVVYIALNRRVAPFDDPQIQRAFTLGIDNLVVANDAYAGHARPAALLLNPAMPGYNDVTRPEPDLRRARELQANAGRPDGFDTSVYVDTRIPNWQGLTESLRYQLGDLYIEGDLSELDRPLNQIADAQPPLALVVTVHLTPDPYAAAIWLAEPPPPQGRNFTGYQNPAYFAWVEQATAALTPQARATALDGARQELASDSPLVPLVAPDVLAATTHNVTGLKVSPLGWVVVDQHTLVLP